MQFRCIRTHENFPGRPGRLRFTVRCGLVVDPSELELFEKYGAPLLEALFSERLEQRQKLLRELLPQYTVVVLAPTTRYCIQRSP